MTHGVIQQLEAYGAYADAVAPAISTDELDLRSAERIPTRTPQRRAFPNWAVAVGAAAAVFILIGGVLWLIGGTGSDVIDEPSPSTTTTLSLNEPAGTWNPILSTTIAREAPAAATCPEGTNPDAPGPIDQARPGEGPWNNQAAVFDTHTGRIVFLNEAGETWTFDVCTNTWHQTTPTGVPGVPHDGERIEGEMVYDVDSDRTIAFGSDSVSVYNANTDEWQRRSTPSGLDLDSQLGAVYDPVSGLILVVNFDGVLMAYDVDTDGWARVGIITEPREVTHNGYTQTLYPPFLVGYVAEVDRLAFLGYENEPFQDDGALVNPRTGTTAPLEHPPVGVEVGFGRFPYATGGDTAYTYRSGVCRLDPVSFDWDCIPNGDTGGPDSVVYDLINDRLVIINNSCCNWPGNKVEDDVWAIDFATGRSIELLDTANTRTETDGS